MDKTAAQNMVKDTLEQPFDFGRFADLVNNILNRFEHDRSPKKDCYPLDAFIPYISKHQRLGSYEDSAGKVIDILVVILKKETSLERARSIQRNFVARCLENRRGRERSGALVAFVAPNQADWRFSLVKMEYQLDASGKVEKNISPARRYSFLVGGHESSHTAQSRLMPFLLNDTDDPTLDALESAFGVETVTKEFFAKYRELFVRLKDALDDIVAKNCKVKADFTEKEVNTGSFAKRLLGQVVFLYFLQKKGWFGVARDADWGEGSKRFLRELFAREHGNYENFFNDILEPLFYEALRYNRGVDDDYFSKFNCKIPFLNGGLFEPMKKYDWIKIDILLGNDLFSNSARTKEGDTGDGILDVFDRYNFTVKEDEPLEKEVAVDPEMLGKVFENLLAVKDRKSKGAYYTPREVVHYMCQESLVNYLSAKLHGKVDADDLKTLIYHSAEIAENDRQVVRNERETETYSFKLPVRTYEQAGIIDNALASIRICDPAIGSGAFPVGMMNEIVRARSALTGHGELKEARARTAYHFKRHAIEKCLYGVDIDSDATDIAKLRLWLSLIVDEENRAAIKPLPNLDYKIMRGNSLLSVEKDLAHWDAISKLEPLRLAYFNESDSNKQDELQQDIEQRIREISGGKGDFAFWLYFSEVFHKDGQGGFDVVIANPPYVQLQKNSSELGKLYQDKGFETFAKSGDIYQLFYEKGYRLLGEGGHLCFITSNKWMRAGYGKSSRKFLANTSLQAVIDFGGLPVFEASTNPAIVLAQKLAPAQSHGFTAAVIKDVADIPRIRKTVQQKGFEMTMSDLSVDGWTLDSPAVLALLEKMRRAGVSLKKHVRGKVYRGFTTGYNDAFVVDEASKNKLIADDPKSTELIKPWLRGRDIKRWHAVSAGLHFISIESSANRKWPWSGKKESSAEKIFVSCYPAVHKHLSAYKMRLKKRLDQGEYWWELRSCSYVHEFEKPKMIYPIIATEMRAMRDNRGFYMNDKCFLVADAGDFLLALLNSTLMDFYFRNKLASLGDPFNGGGMEFRKIFMQKIPIATHDKNLEQQIAAKAKKIMSSPQSTATAKLEAEIDKLVYQLYGLTPEEITVIETHSKK